MAILPGRLQNRPSAWQSRRVSVLPELSYKAICNAWKPPIDR